MERTLVLTAIFAALIAALGLLPPVALASGVPITAQSLGVMLAGCVLGARRGGLAVLLFVALVLMGLPLLSGGRGGLGVLASPTAGFVVGFPVAAFVTGWITERLHRLPLLAAAWIGAVLGGIGVLYLFGIAGMALMLDKPAAQAALLATPYLPGDLIKSALAAMLTSALARARPGLVASHS